MDLARRAGVSGGTAPAVFNAANEAAVAAFLAGRSSFLAIVDTVEQVLAEHVAAREPGTQHAAASLTVEDVLGADAWAQAPSRRAARDDDGGTMSAAGLVGLLVFVVGILGSIALHEVGHLVPAKRFGVRVTQYMVGFGPTMWSRVRGETEYGVKAVPLGGYIRMVGMFPPRRNPKGELVLAASSTGPFQSMIEDARRTSAEEIQAGEEHRAFYQLTRRRRSSSSCSAARR